MPSESLTVTLLPDLLALVHIPRSRLVHFSHQVVKQILHPSPTFLNITCNKIELHVPFPVVPLTPSNLRIYSSLFAHYSILSEFESLARKDRQRLRKATNSRRPHGHSRPIPPKLQDPVEVSYDTWNVLQLDSHDDRLDKAGARVRELSAPLADGGISILYQSSYTSDFIFVKSSRLSQVLARLAQAGFVGYSFESNSGPSSTLSTHPGGSDESESDSLPSEVVRRSTDGITIELVLQRDQTPAPLPVSSPPSDVDTGTPTPPASSTFAHRNSLSHCAGDVEILDQDVVCVGLSDASAETWASKIIKLVAYPELIVPVHTYSSSKIANRHSVVTISTPLNRSGFQSSPSITIPQRSYDIWSTSPSDSSPSSPATSPSSSCEDGYFSSAPLYTSSSESYPDSPTHLQYSRSFPEISGIPSLPYKTRINNIPAVLSTSASYSTPAQDAVPYFSFTRTAEGSSLTTGRQLITALFPPSERHMVICGNELGTGDDDLEDEDVWAEPHLGSGSRSPVNSSTMKCLQIDLQRFGLDKYGLINRFSKVLDSSGINHMYSSTYKTANLLVAKRDAVRAAALLRSC